ncbi:MAG: helix-turn-helix transcriptional regulator [Patescibacteria group bacterium]|jgi:transcriptional regulator with XRE-family HTH domain
MNITLGQRILELRKQRNISRKELSEILNVSYSTLAGYETDYSSPDYSTLKKICWFFSVTADHLLDLPEYADPEKRELRYFLTTKDITFNGIKINEDEREAAKIALNLVFRIRPQNTQHSARG